MNQPQPRGRPCDAISLACENQALYRHLAGCLSFGGELGQHRARRLARTGVRNAIALLARLDPSDQRAA